MEYKTGLWKKQNEKQPDFNIIIRENTLKNENTVQNKEDNTNVFEEFGKMINIDDELLD